MGHTSKTDFKMPEAGELGTSGNRRPININALESMFKDYNQGDGVVIDDRGVMHGGNSRKAQELLDNETSVAVLQDQTTTM